MAGSSKATVVAGISANLIVTVTKFIGFAITGSGALLSEAIHSAADTSNQALLLFGLRRSEKPADAAHPLGYGKARFFWGLVSAMGIFFLGAGVTLYHGILGLVHPHESHYGATAWIVLGIALVIETGALAIAARGMSADAQKAGVSFGRYVREGRDPTSLAVLLEDGAAVLGVILAAIGIAMATITHNPRWDAMASIAIGILLAFVAIFLVAKNRIFLLTKSLDGDIAKRVLDVIESRASVEDVTKFQAVLHGLDRYGVAAEIDFDGRVIAEKVLGDRSIESVAAEMGEGEALRTWLGQFAEQVVEALGDEIDVIEDEIRGAIPHAREIDIETE